MHVHWCQESQTDGGQTDHPLHGSYGTLHWEQPGAPSGGCCTATHLSILSRLLSRLSIRPLDGRRETYRRPDSRIEGLPHLGLELRATVWHDVSGDSMQAEHMLCHWREFLERRKMWRPRKVINSHHDYHVSLGRWQSNHEIHCDVWPLVLCDSQQLKEVRGGLVRWFPMGADGPRPRKCLFCCSNVWGHCVAHDARPWLSLLDEKTNSRFEVILLRCSSVPSKKKKK